LKFTQQFREPLNKALKYLRSAEDHLLRIISDATDEGDFKALKFAEKLRKDVFIFKGDIETINHSVLIGGGKKTKEATLSGLMITDYMLLLESMRLEKTFRESSSSYSIGERETALKEMKSSEGIMSRLKFFLVKRKEIASGRISKEELYNLREEYEKEIRETPEYTETEIGALGKTILAMLRDWDEKIGLKDWKEDLLDLILKIGEETKKETGGILRLSELYLKIKEEKPVWPLTLDHVEEAVETLAGKGLIQEFQDEETRIKYVVFTPASFSEDEKVVLEMAASKGWVTMEEIIKSTGWSEQRVNMVLSRLEKIGAATPVVDAATGKRWFFPSFASEKKNEVK